MISEIIGTFVVVFSLISAIVYSTLHRDWEKSMLESVFGKTILSEEQKLIFKYRLSYLGLYNLHYQVEQNHKEQENELVLT